MKELFNDMETRCELALMGKCVPVKTQEEVNEMTQYILKAMGCDTHFQNFKIREERITNSKYRKQAEVKYLVTNTVCGMPCITYLIDFHDGETSAPFETDYGTGYPCATCYVFNPKADDMCSEWGDCFFKKRSDGFYHRVS